MICKECLNNIPDGAVFCPVCGGSITQSATVIQETPNIPSVGSNSPTNANESNKIPFCYICSLELESGATVCPVCGAQAGYKEKSEAYSAIYGTNKAADSVQNEIAFGDFAGLDSSASVVVKPIKKKSRVPLIAGISAGAAVLVLGGVFALNRATFLPMFMGEAGYAAMIEAKSAASIVEKVADNTVTNAFAEHTAKHLANHIDIASDTIVYNYGEFSAKSVIAQINESLKDYDESSLSVELSPSIQLTDAGMEILFGGEAAYEEWVSALNQTNTTLALTANENVAAFGIALDENGMVTDANVILSDDNTIYIDIPFADKAFKYSFKEYISDDESTAEYSKLTLDPKETERIIRQISNIYTTRYKSADFTIEKGELTAVGVTAKGQLVCCEMDSECLNGLFGDIASLLAQDEYLSAVIVEYINTNGGEITAQEYEDAVAAIAENNSIDEDCALIIKTIVNGSCNIIAKSVICIDGDSEASFTYVNGKSKAAFEIINGDDRLTADITKQNKSDGTVNVKYTGDKSFSAKAVYRDIKEVEYGGKKIFEGTIRLSCVPPADFSESGSFAAVYAALSKMELSLTQSIDGKKLKQHIELRVPQYGTAAIDAVTSNTHSEITVPENAFDLNTLYDSDDNYKKLCEILSAIAESADKDSYFAGKIAEAAQSAAQDIEDSFKPQAEHKSVSALLNEVRSLIETTKSLNESHADVMTDEYKAQCDDITKRLEALEDTIESEYSNYNMTLERYEEFYEQECAINEELGKLITALNKAQDAKVTISQRGEIDYSELDAFDLFDAFHACESDFLSIVLVHYGEIENDENMLSLYNEAADAYEKAYDDILTLNEQMTKGNWAAQLVRDTRRSVEKFDKAISALESRLGGKIA